MLYAIGVEKGKECIVKAAMQKEHVKAIVPQEWRKKETKTEIETLFPGLVFADIPYNARTYYLIKSIPHIVEFTHKPLTYTEESWVRLLENVLEPSIIQENGREIKIVSGILKAFKSRITKVNRKVQNVTVSITLNGKERTFDLCYVKNEDKTAVSKQKSKESDIDITDTV